MSTPLSILLELSVVALALVAGWAGYRILFRILSAAAARSGRPLTEQIVADLRPGIRLLLPVIAARAALSPLSRLPPDAHELAHHVLVVLGIGAVTRLLIGVVGAIASFVRTTHDLGVSDNLEARRVHTQVNVLERTTEVVVVILGVAFALMTFPGARALGTGLLASAGVVGLAVGLAARPLLENLIAGVQLALTQPIRVDDVVIVHGEWGRIEEITTTYVVVRIWDERRLVVPFSTFIQQPFENWTRTSADILGTVFLWADYTVPVEQARAALEEIVRANPLWDGRVCNVQVVDTTEQAVKLRALISASDSGRAWDLRVHVREQWLAWLQQNHRESLPRSRVVVSDRESARPT
jgi:small-conductance mechanosensitive channel